MLKKHSKIEISVIIGHYGHGLELKKCLDSLLAIKKNFKSIEFILVDNNEDFVDEKFIKSKYKWIKYINKNKNFGWGGARNLALKYASGKYIYFCDSDIVINLKSFKNIYKFIKNNNKVGIVSPRMRNFSGKYTPEATNHMTPLVGIFYQSFLNKLFPENFIVKNYLLNNWDRKSDRCVDVSQFGGFFMKRDVYDKIGGFDEKLFLYFEENDVAKRIHKIGYKNYFKADSEIIHLESKGTPKASNEIKKVFANSRYHYFKKHFGLFSALLVEIFSRVTKNNLLILSIIFLGLFLRFYKLPQNAIFNGEMGTDYLNVLNMFSGDRSIWVGPRTSHEWFFIPPISYWVYAILFKIFGFNPLIVNYFWAVIGTLAIFVCYYYIKKLFDDKIALIASFLISVSPLWISMTRDARYNAPVAILFFPYLYYLKNSINDNGKSLFKLGLVLGFSMSFFPSPILLIPATIVSFLIFKSKPSIKYIIYGALGFLIPNSFYLFNLDSVKNILLWIPYRLMGFAGLYPKNNLTYEIMIKNFETFIKFLYANFLPNIN